MPNVSLKIKVVIPVTVMILAVILTALIVVNQVVHRQVLASVSNELNKSRRIFTELQGREWRLLLERALVTSQAPHLKAAVDTGDSTTVQHVAEEFFGTVGSDILIITDEGNRILAQLGFETDPAPRFHPDSLMVQEKLREGEIGLLNFGSDFYQVVSVPILSLDEITGVYILGRVILGKIIDGRYLAGLKDLVDCEVAFLHDHRIEVSTNPQFTTPAVFRDENNLQARDSDGNGRLELEILGEEFLSEFAGKHGNFLLLQSVDRAFKPIMQPIQSTMILVGFAAILAALLISRFISLSVIQPVTKLVRATDAVTAGNYGHPIAVRSRDELGHLANKFDEMRQSLQQKMAQLKQQNLELEDALRKLEAAQEELVRSEKLAATGKITAQLSHELNNPIHNIQSCLEAAQRKLAKTNKSREFIDLAYDEVLRMGKLIRQMLDFYRPQVNPKQQLDVGRVIHEVLKTSEPMLTERGIEVSSSLNNDVVDLSTTPDQLKQVFLNLVLNAVDAMPRGGRITVSSLKQNQHLNIQFEDTGCGISPQHLNKIFEAFFTTKAKASGVGLGLTVSYGIVRSLGGNILVESEIDKGSRFTVQLPLS